MLPPEITYQDLQVMCGDYRVVKRADVRKGPEMTSLKVGSLDTGEIWEAYETQRSQVIPYDYCQRSILLNRQTELRVCNLYGSRMVMGEGSHSLRWPALTCRSSCSPRTPPTCAC